MEAGTSATPESPGVQAFIQARQADLLVRAVSTLAQCPEPELPHELHRLSGTLGTYQLTEAREVVKEFEAVVKGPGATPAEIEKAREAAVARLTAAIATSAPSDNEGESSP